MITVLQYISIYVFLYTICVITLFDVLQKEKKEPNIITQVQVITAKQQQDEILLTPRETVSVPLGIVRLGNHLFKYASGFGIAKDRDANFCTEQPSHRFQMFEGPFVDVCSKPPEKTITEKHYGVCDFRFYKEYNGVKHLGLRRYFQCHEYFDKYEEEIRQMFEIKTSYYIKAKTYLENLIGNDNNGMLSCFHYRLGDMARSNQGMSLPSKEFYLKTVAMILNQTIYQEHQFLIVSDEPEKAFEELNYLEAFANVDVSHANLETDFIMMAKFCDNIVFSRGTFAWWAAYLNKKAKVYYRDEFENNYLSIDVNRETYYMPKWQKVE